MDDNDVIPEEDISEKNLENSNINYSNPENNDFEIKNSIINEAIVNYIINYSISIAINSCTLKEAYKKENLHCFNYLKKLINTYLSIGLIQYENTPNSNDISDNNSFFNIENSSKSNTWTYISEPEPAAIDRCSNRNLLKQTDHKHIYQITNDENNEFKEESININANNNKLFKKKDVKKKAIMHTKTLKREEKVKVNESIKSKDGNNDDDPYKDYKVIKKKKFINIKGLLTIQEDKIIEMPSYDIKDKKENFENINEKEELNKLRKEFQYLIEQKKRENNLLLLKPNRRKSQINFKFSNNFDSNRYTFDTNGKILYLNLPKLSPISSEFNIPKQNVIDKDTNNNNNNSQTNKRKSIIFRKPIISSFEKYNINVNSDITKRYSAKTISIRNKTSRNRTSSLPNNSINNNTSNFNTKRNRESVEYNPRELKINLNKDKIKEKDKDRDKNAKSKKVMIIGGPNFEKIVPEVGVVIHDGNKLNKTKSGGFKYSSKYYRMSFKELSQILDNKGKYSSVDNSSFSFNQDNNNNYNGYNEKFNDNNNPLLENAHSIRKERILSSFSENRKKSNNNNNYNSIDISSPLNKIGIKRNMNFSLSRNNSEIKMLSKISNMKLSSDNYINNIYDLLKDEQKDITSSCSIDKTNKSKGLASIKEIINIKRKLPSIEELIKKRTENMKGRYIINKFNYNIIKNKDWGNKFNFNKKNDNDESNLKNNNIIFRKEKYRKLKIIDNNHNKLNILGKNILRKKSYSSSSNGAFIS